MSSVVNVVVTGAAGQVGYLLAGRIAQGNVFGKDVKLSLRLLETPEAIVKAQGLAMELVDCAYSGTIETIVTTDVAEAFKDVDVAFLAASVARQKGWIRTDMLAPNAKIYEAHGKALSAHAKKTVKVLVIANPCNTNCLVCQRAAANIPKENFVALTRLDQNRATAVVASKAGTTTGHVHNVVVWGNHGKSQVPDIQHAHVETRAGPKPVSEVVSKEFLRDGLVDLVSHRGNAIVASRGTGSALSAVAAAISCMREWWFGTAEGTYSSMGIVVPEDEPYGVKQGIVFSFPCTVSSAGKISVVSGLKLDGWTSGKLRLTEKDIINERDMLAAILAEQAAVGE